MKIFVTGGHGFLGKHLVATLQSRGDEVTAPTRNQCDLQDLNNFQKFQDNYDQIYHLAAHTQAGDWCLRHPGEQWLVNQSINTNILTWWYRHCPTAKLITIGTSCSYAPGESLVEEKYMEGAPIESLYTYAMTKRMLLQGLRAINKQYGLDYLYLVPSTLYGSGYHLDGRQMHFIFDLIKKIIRGKELGENITLWGDGYQKREIFHVQDFIFNMNQLIKVEKNEIYNLGSGIEFSIREYASIICEITGFDKASIFYDTSRYTGAKSKVLDVSKAKKEIGLYANRDLRKGLKEVIDWFYQTKSYL
jgi:GDP-L-fucose synthase